MLCTFYFTKFQSKTSFPEIFMFISHNSSYHVY
uniref:Uncharacterized protein n=1 Tax=Arundo donax TaxID=35708 RepID=A0A0A9H076_ARUDO